MYKLSISNIAWSEAEDTIFASLQAHGVQGVEIAPTKLASWDLMNESHFEMYREMCSKYELQISSFQAILYGRPELQLLGGKEQFIEFTKHIKRISNYAQLSGAGCLVFGAPKNRLLLNLGLDAAFQLAVDRFRILADVAYANGVRIAIEPVPECYGGDFLTHYNEVLHLVQTANHPGLSVHLDTACIWLADNSISEAIYNSQGSFCHFHVSEKSLGTFDNPDPRHVEAAKALISINYPAWICIEMKQGDNVLSDIEHAVSYVKSIYLNNLESA